MRETHAKLVNINMIFAGCDPPTSALAACSPVYSPAHPPDRPPAARLLTLLLPRKTPCARVWRAHSAAHKSLNTISAHKSLNTIFAHKSINTIMSHLDRSLILRDSSPRRRRGSVWRRIGGRHRPRRRLWRPPRRLALDDGCRTVEDLRDDRTRLEWDLVRLKMHKVDLSRCGWTERF